MLRHVYFATNRVILNEAPLKFGDVADEDAPPDMLYRVGKAAVEQVGHPWGMAGRAFKLREATLCDEAPAADGAPERPGSDEMLDKIAAEIRAHPRDVIVYIHGAAAHFEGTMMRTAELQGAWLCPPRDGDGGAKPVEPILLAFSWPSDRGIIGPGNATGGGKRKWKYWTDRDDAEYSGRAIARLLMRVLDRLAVQGEAGRCPARIHVVAHSMGNWALANALRAAMALAEREARTLPMVFDTLFLMASDLVDDALERADMLAPALNVARRIVVYHAGNDGALRNINKLTHDNRRLGLGGPPSMARLPEYVTAIDCAEVSQTPPELSFRHQYFRLAPEVIADVRAVIAEEAPDAIPNRKPAGERRWRLAIDRAARDELNSHYPH